MARWSDPIQLKQYYHWKRELNHPGVYEIGFCISEQFNAKYIGKASDTIYKRLYKHWNRLGSASIARYYEEKKRKEQRDMLYFHFIVTENYDAMEANLLDRWGIGKDGGSYEWNRKYEPLEE